MVNPRRRIERQRLEELNTAYNTTPTIRNLVQMQESISLKKPIFMMGQKSKGQEDYQALWSFLNL